MLASDKLIKAFNEQVGHELGASNQYVAIAAHFDGEALPRLAAFYYRQAEEERGHAMKFVRFVVEVGGRVDVPAVPAAKSGFKSAEDAVALTLAHEEKVTRQIYDLVEQAQKEKNFIALRFLDWFVTEQLEEVSTASALLQVVRRAGPDRLFQVEDFLSRGGASAAGSAREGGAGEGGGGS
jgi:ferritin